MVNLKREGLSLLLKWGRAIFESEDSRENTKETKTTENPEPSSVEESIAEPMKAYWETDKQTLANNNQEFIDSFLKGKALERIPDTTEEPVKESHYKFAKINIFHYPEASKYNFDATQAPKPGTGISSSGRDAGVVAGIVVAVISGVLILAALIAVVLYKHYVHRNVTSMNFDNPVYRKTTEDQFALEKNGYAPGSKLYPSTVGEEAREPLNTPGTNEYV